MGRDNTGDRVAVLIDADNVSSKNIAGLMAEVVKYGTASVRRIYGDWTSPYMRAWRECLLEHSLIPIQQFAYTTGKNATDGTMIIDAMDLLYTDRFSSFCLVSSDSDFTRLAARIREQGIPVYGFGNRHNTHPAFIAACNEFIYLDALSRPADESDEPDHELVGSKNEPSAPTSRTTERPQPTGGAMQPYVATGIQYQPPMAKKRRHDEQVSQPGPSSHRPHNPRPTPRPFDQGMLDVLINAIGSSPIYDDDNFVNLADVGQQLVKMSPDMNARNYGYLRIREFVEASGIVEVKMKSREPAPPIALARLKRDWGEGSLDY